MEGNIKTMALRDFCGCLVVWTSPANAGGVGSIPGRRDKIPHVSWPKNAAKKQYRNKFSKDLTKTKSLWHSCLVFFNNCQLGLVASGNLPGDPLPPPLSERLHLRCKQLGKCGCCGAWSWLSPWPGLCHWGLSPHRSSAGRAGQSSMSRSLVWRFP